MGRVAVVPIATADLDRVGEFLHRNLNERLSPADWAGAARAPWTTDAPNHGFMLVDDGAIVGVYLAFYSTRTFGERTEKFCNLAAWCVLPKYRLYSLQLLKALLAQPGYHFTDLSPSGNTVPVNERLKFGRLDTATALMANLPWPALAGRRKVISDRGEIERRLTGPQLQIFRDHQHARAANHVLLVDGERHCYVIFRRDRRKNLPLFASILYVSDVELFRSMARQFGSHLLLRHGVLATLMELRVIGAQPSGSRLLRTARPKMFRSDSLRPDQIDYLYSELVCVAW